jgi:hypothetical protein
VSSGFLREKKGGTKSCGCLVTTNLVGKKFGRWTVIKKTNRRSSGGQIFWKCQCSCPDKTIKYIVTGSLTSGLSKSCICLQIELLRNPNLTDEDRAYGRNIPGYKDWVKSVYKRDNHTCQCCGSKKKLHAHHIRDYATYSELRLELSNGITLCQNCHIAFHIKYGKGYNNPWQLTRFIKNYKNVNKI